MTTVQQAQQVQVPADLTFVDRKNYLSVVKMGKLFIASLTVNGQDQEEPHVFNSKDGSMPAPIVAMQVELEKIKAEVNAFKASFDWGFPKQEECPTYDDLPALTENDVTPTSEPVALASIPVVQEEEKKEEPKIINEQEDSLFDDLRDLEIKARENLQLMGEVKNIELTDKVTTVTMDLKELAKGLTTDRSFVLPEAKKEEENISDLISGLVVA